MGDYSLAKDQTDEVAGLWVRTLCACAATAVALTAPGCARNQAPTRALHVGRRVGVTASITQEALGLKLQIGGAPAALRVSLTNGSGVDLSVGTDLYVMAGPEDHDRALLVSGGPLDDQKDRALMYACRSSLFSRVERGRLTGMVFGAGGQGLRLDDSLTKEYKGTWGVDLPAGGVLEIAQRLVMLPSASQGWFATPALTASDQRFPPFRIMAELGEQPTGKRYTLPMTAACLSEFAADTTKPVELREWAVVWAARLVDPDGPWAVSQLLSDAHAEPEVRKAAARALATQAPANALEAVNSVMWDAKADPDLQLTCYYALTWSPHEAAKEMVRKAATHSHPEIKASAAELTEVPPEPVPAGPPR